MPPVPVLRPREVIRTFERFGWHFARQTGSHIIRAKPGHRSLSVPNHPTVGRGTLRALIRDAGLTVEEFLEALDN